MLVASNTTQLARRDFLFSDHDQVLSTPEDLCTIRAQNCALFLLTNNGAPRGGDSTKSHPYQLALGLMLAPTEESLGGLAPV